MKKGILFLTIILCFGLLLCACGKEKNETQTEASAQTAALIDGDIILPEDGKIEFGKKDNAEGTTADGKTGTEEPESTGGSTADPTDPTTDSKPTQGGTPSQGTTPTSPSQGNSGTHSDPTASSDTTEAEPTGDGSDDDDGWGDVVWN